MDGGAGGTGGAPVDGDGLVDMTPTHYPTEEKDEGGGNEEEQGDEVQ